MSAFPGVPVLSCAAVGPAAVDVSGILAGAKVSGFSAIPTAVDFPSAVDVPSAIDVPFAVDVPSSFTVSNVSGVPAVAGVPALVLPCCCLRLYSCNIPTFFNIAFGPDIAVALFAIDVEFLAVAGVSALTPLLLMLTSLLLQV